MSRLDEIRAAADRLYKDLNRGAIDAKAWDRGMSRLEKDAEASRLHAKNVKAARGFAGVSDSADHNRAAGQLNTKAFGVNSEPNLSPMDIPHDELHAMFEATRRKQPYRCQVGAKVFGDGSGVGMKTPGAPIAEGAPWPSGLLPPVVEPGLTQEYRFEPDRIADHIPTITMDAPSIEYLVQQANTNPAQYTEELGTKVDIGINLATQTAVPVKLSALASVSMEALADFDYFASWVPRVLTNAVINVETQQIALGTGASGAYPGMTGFINTPGVLRRSYNSGDDTSGIDTLLLALDDIRNQANVYGIQTPSDGRILMSPGTWSNLRRTKTTTDAFVLNIMDPNEIGTLTTLFGTPVIVNSVIPNGTAIVFDAGLAAKYFVRQGLTVDVNMWGDTQWTTNSVSYRCETRSVLAVLRAGAVNIVDGLSYDSVSAS